MTEKTSSESACCFKNVYKCCKDKEFKSYVCVKCYNIYHKSCLNRMRNKKFLGGHKITCCESESETNLLEDEIEILKSELSALNQDNTQKSSFIDRLKLENYNFIQEAVKNEEEMNNLINAQESEIKELKKYIDKMNKNSRIVSDEDKKTVGIQTETKKKVYAKEADKSYREKIPERQKKIMKKTGTQLNINNHGKTDSREVEKKNNILILGDSNSTDFASILRKMCNNEYSVTSFIKHNALLDHILEDVVNLTKDYGKKDYVVVIGGLMNMVKGVDVHDSVINILKQISLHTNIIILSIPLWKYRVVLNNLINKHNIKIVLELCINNESATFLNVNSVLNNKFFFVKKMLFMKYNGKVLIGERIKNIVYGQSVANAKATNSHQIIENKKSTDESQYYSGSNEASQHNQSRENQYNVSLMEELRDAEKQEELDKRNTNGNSFFGHHLGKKNAPNIKH